MIRRMTIPLTMIRPETMIREEEKGAEAVSLKEISAKFGQGPVHSVDRPFRYSLDEMRGPFADGFTKDSRGQTSG